MKCWIVGLAVALAVLPLGTAAQANVFNMGGTRNVDGSWTGLASLETVPVGNLRNTADANGFGAVDYAYTIGKYEVTNAQWREFLTAKAAVGDPYGLYSTNMATDWGGIARSGSGTVAAPWVYSAKNNNSHWDNLPVNYVSFWDAARFCNWLHNGQGDGDTENGAYSGIGDQAAFAREPDSKYFIPTEDEWYKAAYHKNNGDTGNYFDYPMSNDGVPSNDLLASDAGNNANFYQDGYTVGSPYWTTVVGDFEESESPYDTFDQGGNVWEWTEAFLSGLQVVIRGGSVGSAPGVLAASARYYLGSPTNHNCDVGFRVASVPDPGDTDLDGDIDLDDLNNFSDGWYGSRPASWATGNFDGDYNVDLDDLNLFSDGWYGPHGPGGEGLPLCVPEPSTLISILFLLATAALGFAWHRRHPG